jgi:hypothetical protein
VARTASSAPAEKLGGSFEEQAAAISASVGGPWMTRSEARALNNLPPLPEVDELLALLNVTQGGLASPPGSDMRIGPKAVAAA